MSDKIEFSKRILESANNNQAEIQEMFKEILKLVPSRKRAKAKKILDEAQMRTFFGHYLYECYGEVVGPFDSDPEEDVILKYDKYVNNLFLLMGLNLV